MKILKTVDKSVLWLLEDNSIAKKNLKKEAKKRKIDPKRIIFAKHMSMTNHFARHKCADLFIDTFPYGAHTTCSDSLWAGLPIVTLMGKSFASRVGSSLLNAINLKELITTTEKEYEKLIIELANNSYRLKEIRNKLHKNRFTKPLFDTKLYTKNIELAYTKIYEKHLNKLPAKNIDI